jgi:hypothetical protein
MTSCPFEAGTAEVSPLVEMGIFSRSEKTKEQERFYLLPGMGGSALRRKRKMMLRWSIAAGLVVSGILALLLYYFSEHSR